MSEVRATKNLVAKVQGDSWRGLPVIRIRVNGVAPSIPVASARMVIKKNIDDTEIALLLSTEDGTIVINDAGDWYFTVPPIIDFTLAAGNWVYSFKTVRTDGYKRTYFGGQFKILKTVDP